MIIDSAHDLLMAGESAIVLFTRDMRLVVMNRDGTGTSGNWHLKPDQHGRPDKVIIYSRLPSRGPVQSEITLADYVDAKQSSDAGRFVIIFRNAQQVGIAYASWVKFAATGTNPVRYITKK